ncbi:MAG: DUF47 family protein [Thermodesulfobacteriota bacterium]|nr:DUF47 family protein [Thermodesulfobacteriota bacterium]
MGFDVLKKTMGIERKINDFLDQVSEAGMLFGEGVEFYLNGRMDVFAQKLDAISEKEHQGDILRKTIDHELYTRTLIPESRGDVLRLMEDMDSLLDRFKGAMWRFEIERVDICADLHDDFLGLVSCVCKSVEAMISSSRAFFNDIEAVSDHMHKVSFWETESDKASTRLQRAIFSKKDIELSHRLQLRDFAVHIDRIADRAEDAADNLGIYVIKRSL